MTLRHLVLTAAGLLLLAACDSKPKVDANDPYAGLDQAILAWKTDLAANHASCKPKAAGQKCEGFEVACKALRVITPEEQAKGVTTKLVANIGWSGFDEHGAPEPASASAEFSKSAGAWTRKETKPVNPATCADL